MAADLLDASSQIQEFINRLRSPIPDLATLLSLLAAPLDCLSILPPRFHRHNTSPLPGHAFRISRHTPLIQRAILEHVVPTWKHVLEEESALSLLDQHFVPDAFMNAKSSSGLVAMHAYSTILSLPLREHSVSLLILLSTSYPIDRLYTSIYDSSGGNENKRLWEDIVRSVLSVPAKVANALEGKGIPPELEQGTYFSNMSRRSEVLIFTLAERAPHFASTDMALATFLLTKLVNVGLFPLSRELSRSQASFFGSTLDRVRSRLDSPDARRYSTFWSNLLSSIPSVLTVQSILLSLIVHLEPLDPALSTSPHLRWRTRQEAGLLRSIIGDASGIWDSVSAVIVGRDWDEGYARIFAYWAAGTAGGKVDERTLKRLLDMVLDVWTSSEHIKHSLLSKHRYITLLLLSLLKYLPASSPILQELPFSPTFVQSIGYYISHLDQSIRRCGMLAAEEVAHLAKKDLDFKDWDGDSSDKTWARKVRTLLAERDIDAEIPADDAPPATLDTGGLLIDEPVQLAPAPLSAGYDSDDSLSGYQSTLPSRSPSPTPQELTEIEKDPTLNVGKKKIVRPVYLAQLGELIRSTSGTQSGEDTQEADKIAIALDVAEELIRKKQGYGTELEENVVNLVYGLIGLKDNYELDRFDRNRQAALIALVACCPSKAAPAIIEEFFKNQYSIDQRFIMLNSLALAALELTDSSARDGSPSNSAIRALIDFPSKRLPLASQERYIQAVIARPQSSLNGMSLEDTRIAAEDRVAVTSRERQLRIRRTAKITEINNQNVPSFHNTSGSRPTFAALAVDYFLYPLMNRFWTFLRDEQAREARTAARDPLHRYRGAGTALVLSPSVLSQFLATLAVLVHASRMTPVWRSVVAPDALELALTLGTRPVSRDDDVDETGGEEKEARVLANALELALVVLEGSAELDDGRVLALEHTALLIATSEWAQTVFSALDKGLKVPGGGGAAEMQLNKVAASTILKADEISRKWKRSMIAV